MRYNTENLKKEFLVKLILLMFVMVTNVYSASDDVVVKLGADTKNYNSNLIMLDKELRLISVKLINLDNSLAIPSHAAGEINKLERTLQRATDVSNITQLIPSLKEKGLEFRNSIKEIQPSVQKAREVSDEVSVELVKFHKSIKETKESVKNIHIKVKDLIKKDVPTFHNEMTETQDCVYKAEQSRRKCMQDELNSGADDLQDVIKDSKKEVLALIKTVEALKGKTANLQIVLKNIYSTISLIQSLEISVNRTIVPYLDLYKIMNKDYAVKFLMPNPYNTKKNSWFYIKVAGKDIIIGVLHTMDEIEKKLRGELLNQANKASVKKLAQSLGKTLDKDFKKVMKRLNTKINFSIKGLETLHKINSTLIDPLEDLVSTMKDVKLEVPTPKAVACESLVKECK